MSFKHRGVGRFFFAGFLRPFPATVKLKLFINNGTLFVCCILAMLVLLLNLNLSTLVIKTTYLESFPACETKGFVVSP